VQEHTGIVERRNPLPTPVPRDIVLETTLLISNSLKEKYKSIGLETKTVCPHPE